MSCTEYERTSAFLDGELDDRESAEVEQHLETCPHCQALAAAAGEASELLRGPAARLTAPAGLRARIGQRLDAEAATVVRLPRVRRQSGWDRFWVGAAGGVGASAIAAALALVAFLPPSAATLTGELADAHIDALMSGRTIAVVSSSHHTVKPWFAGRAPLSPPVADFAPQGFTLTGGRVDRIGRKKAAVVVYRHGAHEIDLYAWPTDGALPQDSDRRGYHLIFWTMDDLSFAAVSDMQKSELEAFVQLVKSERE